MKYALLLMLLVIGGAAHAAAPCDRVVVVRDGKVFTVETVNAPGFDSRTAPTAVWCDGDLYPTDDAASLIEDSKKLPVCEERLEIERRWRSNDRASCEADIAQCQGREAGERASRLACERDKAPPPKAVEPSRAAWKRPVFWVGAAILASVVTVVVVTGEDHPLLWAAGGVGAGVMIGGSW